MKLVMEVEGMNWLLEYVYLKQEEEEKITRSYSVDESQLHSGLRRKKWVGESAVRT